eukprot:8899166-Pyramimonas_sp.AAC.1
MVPALPRGSRQGFPSGTSAPRLWGCLEGAACLGVQQLLLSEHPVRMPRARRWFQHSKGEPPGCSHGHVRAQIAGMSRGGAGLGA